MLKPWLWETEPLLCTTRLMNSSKSSEAEPLAAPTKTPLPGVFLTSAFDGKEAPRQRPGLTVRAGRCDVIAEPHGRVDGDARLAAGDGGVGSVRGRERLGAGGVEGGAEGVGAGVGGRECVVGRQRRL